MLSRRFATILGAFLVIEGIWGMFSPVVFGILPTNMLRASIHLVLGLLGLWAARSDRARTYLVWAGSVVLLVGVLRFIPVASDYMASLLAVDTNVAILNIVLGLAARWIAFSDARRLPGPVGA
ncbi:MAG TPA: DUF4383 domain-containing protein [Gemmatimonadaceae bacterium]|nr:DUF4383 domain-containing protein [Gemmatimonadaceae bacterium]